MGYTHSWSFFGELPEKAWAQVIEDAKTIVKVAGIPLIGKGGCNAPPVPVIDVDKGIYLNGDVENGDEFEDFDFNNRDNSNWCKTGRRPYDLVVTAILLRAWMILGPFIHISSDGEWDEWMPARDLVGKQWPEEEITRPMSSNDE
ncbi:hypothetical protein GMOD_00002485 [Pyrenophora seminiperda CCB06]|uniref:Uncharacterized protein n=1 Tax=Pyrenophora seminiperda CCB06 TaxID=1302712 RepID=A0A3M7M2Q4_9PLEO|nr:hypothetical protein GMOD_00002485 [Pyrenophora seminiperda CCB06]